MRAYDDGVYRGMTPEEIAEWEAMENLPTPPPTQEEQGLTLLRSMAAQTTTLSDTVALSVPDLLPAWSPDMGAVSVGQVCRYEDATYRCRQAHTPQAGWEPPTVPALWTVVELSASGTQSDPITAARGMEYTYGLYYKDPEDGNLYLCQRTGEADGGKIILQFLPHELIGHYFTAALGTEYI